MDHLYSYENIVALLTLTSLEIVLGIDNVVFIAILASKLKPEQRDFARKIGLGVAVVSRLLLVLCLSWVMGLKSELFAVLGHSFTGKDLVLVIGGLFLIGKATYELHHRIEGGGDEHSTPKVTSLKAVLIQVALVDIVFSLDSVITAVGMVEHIAIMVIAILLSVAIMLVFSGGIMNFIGKHPTVKVLALAFLLLIGVMLVADGFGQHIPKGYIYFAMAFSLFVELMNIKASAGARARGISS